MHCGWFILPLLLPTPKIWFSLDHKRNVSDGVVSADRRNGNVLIPISSLMTPLTTPIFDFHQVINALNGSAYDSDSDSVASENRPFNFL